MRRAEELFLLRLCTHITMLKNKLLLLGKLNLRLLSYLNFFILNLNLSDAAHRIHPLAGQGVNLGFGDVKCLVKHLKSNVQSGAELGSLIFLQNYESERQKEAFPKIMFIHFLNTLYTTSNTSGLITTPMILARSLGLTLTNRLSILKNFYIQGAMN